MNEIIFCLLVGFILDGIFIVEYYKNHYLNLLIFKTVSSLVFVILGILLAVQQKNGLRWEKPVQKRECSSCC